MCPLFHHMPVLQSDRFHLSVVRQKWTLLHRELSLYNFVAVVVVFSFFKILFLLFLWSHFLAHAQWWPLMEEPLPLWIIASQNNFSREGPPEVILSNFLLRAGPILSWLLRAVSNWVLTTCKDGDAAVLGYLSHYLVSLTRVCVCVCVQLGFPFLQLVSKAPCFHCHFHLIMKV